MENAIAMHTGPFPLFGFVMLLFGGCDEMLPPRNDPVAVVQATFTMYPGIVEIRDSLAAGNEGRIEATLENLFSEVLDDSEYIEVIADIHLKGLPGHTTRVTADRSNLVEQSSLHGYFLTLLPHRPVHVTRQWSHKTNTGAWYWSFYEMTVKSNSTEMWRESPPITFVVEATVQGFKRLAARHLGPYECTVIYRVF